MSIPKPLGISDDVEMKDCDDNFIKVDGIMIKQDFDSVLMSPQDVQAYTQLQSMTMKQAMHLPFTHDVQVLAYFLYEYYANMSTKYEPNVVFSVENTVDVTYTQEMLEITWNSS